MFAKLINEHNIEPFTGKIKNSGVHVYTSVNNETLLNQNNYYEVIDDVPVPSNGTKQLIFDYYEKVSNNIYVRYKEVDIPPTLEEKIQDFLKEHLKPIDAYDVGGEKGTRYYALVFDNNAPEIDTGNTQLDTELLLSIKKVPITDGNGNKVTYYIPLLDEAALERLGVSL